MKRNIQESEFVKRRAQQLEQQGRTQKQLDELREANGKTVKSRTPIRENKWEKLLKFLKKEKRTAQKYMLNAATAKDKQHFQAKILVLNQILNEVTKILEG